MGRRKLTNEDIVERMYDLVGEEYSKLDNIYLGANTKFSIKHNTCGYEYEIAWSVFQRGNRCPKCSLKQRTFKKTFSNEDIVQKIYELVGDEYTKLDDVYVSSSTKFPIKHNICGHEYEIAWNRFQSGRRCPKCNESKGEKCIADYLTNKNISFTTQVKFNDCRHKNPLPFDFGIVDDKNMIIALIEFDGIQHFEPSRFSNNVNQEQAEEDLKQTQLRDQIKNQYCKENNIPLLRIKYNEDIQERLDNFLVSLSLSKNNKGEKQNGSFRFGLYKLS